jgi:hypothetical protein
MAKNEKHKKRRKRGAEASEKIREQRAVIQPRSADHETSGYTGDGDTGVDLAVLQRTKEWAKRQDWTVPKPYDGD